MVGAMTGPLMIMAAGGTGGHMFPAQALSEAMLARGWRVKLSTDARGARYVGGFDERVAIEVVASATFARGGPLAKIAVPFRILAGLIMARRKMRDDRPAVIVGFGGYPSIPAVGAAWALGLPRLIHEQNGVLGRVNQLFARRVDAVACGTWPTQMPAGVTGQHVGNPVRASVLRAAQTPYAPPNDGPMSILVMGGSQGARILSDIVPGAIAVLPQQIKDRLSVSHQARDEDHARVTRAYADAGITADVQPFFADVPDRMARAQLVISRAGASSVADISVIGRPSILVPLASAIRDEQTANARALVDAGAAILSPEALMTTQTLCAEITKILTNRQTASTMAQAAQSVAAPDATDRLVTLVETLASRSLQGAHL